MVFIIYHKDGSKEIYTNKYSEDDEQEVDTAWDDVCTKFSDAEYIELF